MALYLLFCVLSVYLSSYLILLCTPLYTLSSLQFHLTARLTGLNIPTIPKHSFLSSSLRFSFYSHLNTSFQVLSLALCILSNKIFSGKMAPTAVQVVSHREEDSMNNEPSLSGRTIIGLIYPPPDIRSMLLFLFSLNMEVTEVAETPIHIIMNISVKFQNIFSQYSCNYQSLLFSCTSVLWCIFLAIVDKTAAFVARNGVDFENKIREKEASNKRFNFLSPTDPYNAYYKQKVCALHSFVLLI